MAQSGRPHESDYYLIVVAYATRHRTHSPSVCPLPPNPFCAQSPVQDRGAPASVSSSSSSDVLLADTRNKAAAKSTAGSKPSAPPAAAAAAADGAKAKAMADPPPKSPKPPHGPKSKAPASTLPLTIPERVARSKVRTLLLAAVAPSSLAAGRATAGPVDHAISTRVICTRSCRPFL